MEAIDALQQRTSSPRLVDPAPDDAELREIFQAALRAPDHGMLRPWRFLVVRGEARENLGRLFADCVGSDTPEKRAKLQSSPLRAPLVIVAVARIREHPKVPPIEQVCSTAAAAQNISLAAFALGYASIWRTGEAAYDTRVKAGLGLGLTDQIVGYLYLGTPTVAQRPVPEVAVEDYVEEWRGAPD